MLFNPVAIAEKVARLDGILRHPELLQRVIGDWAGTEEFSYTRCPRPWDPGGGATLFRVYTAGHAAFLKVKHQSVTVESRLEGEQSFSREPSLRNEYLFLRRLAPTTPNVPAPLGYYEEKSFCFLFLEMLKPFSQVEARLSAVELVGVYDQIEAFVGELYRHDIVHTDIHELNLLFRGDTPVITDFEEARELRQEVPFLASLDVAGATDAGNVGSMPEMPGFIPGYTSLARLRKVFKRSISRKLPPLLRQCNFDSSCPFLNALDHGKDERIYQSVNLPGLQIQGQRQLDDERIPQILEAIRGRFDHPIVHLDIGCNLGRFNLELSCSGLISESIGVEAYRNYVDLAKVLAFLSDSGKARFVCAECGNDSLFSLLEGRKIDCITIYSVYHHIRNKTAFLEDLRRLRPEMVLLEMPVQPECYDGRSWQQEMDIICQALGGRSWEMIGRTSDYQRPLLVVADFRVQQVATTTIPVTTGAEAVSATPRAPAVSVVLPTYNHLKFLPAAVEGVLQQSLSDFELIVVNDGSTDGTAEYLDGLADRRVRVIHQANRRLPEALNAGFRQARGRYLTWTSADNLCAPTFLERLVEALETHQGAGFACADFAFIDDSNNLLSVQHCHDFFLPRLLTGNPGMAAFLYRRECQDAVGMYDAGLEGAEDWDMWIRIMEKFASCHVPEVLYFYRKHAETMSSRIPDKIRSAVHETFRKAVQRHGGALALEACYPALGQNVPPELRAAAWLDLGIHLLQNPFNWEIYAQQAGHALNQALSLGADSCLVAYLLALQQARSSRWESAEKLLFQALGTSQKPLQASARVLREACLKRELLLVYQAPIPSIPVEIRRKLCRFPATPEATSEPAAGSAATGKVPRIVVVSHFYHDSGGTEVLAADIAEALNAQGHKTELVYLVQGARKDIPREGLPGSPRSIHYLASQDAFVHAINEVAPEAVILLTDILGEILNCLIDHEFSQKFKKIVYLNVNNQAYDLLENHREVAAYKASVLRKYDRVATMFEESLAVRFLERYGVPYDVVTVGIPPAVTEPGSFKSRFGIPAASHLLIYPALVAPMKNQIALIGMEPAIEHDVTIAFLGDLYHPLPEYVEAFQRALSRTSRCLHLPGLKRKDVAQAMAEASICLFPSLSEGAPLTLMEAVSQGLPWVATPEVLFAARLRGGVRIDLEKFPLAINRLLGDPVQLGKLRKEGYSFSWRHHRIEETARSFSNLVSQ